MTEEQKEDIKLLKELIADTSTPNDDREIYQEALNQILAQTKSDIPKAEETKSDMPKVAKEKMPKKEKATPKTKPSKKPKAEKTTPLPSDVDAMKKAIKERTGKTEAECEDIIAQYRKLRAKAKVNNAKRTEKLKSNDDLITGTNVITPVAQIEKDAEIVKAKIEKQVEQIENKAEREVVKKDKTKDEVKVEVEQKVVKQLAKLSDDMVSSATTFVKNIQTELKKVDKTEAKNFLLGLRNEIDALLSKFGDGGSTIETYNITENESASSVNPSLFARGGGVGNPSKKQMLDYLNMYFDNYSELRTIAIEEDNILTRRMLNSLDNEELQMAYDDAKYEIKAETQFAKGGGVIMGIESKGLVEKAKYKTGKWIFSVTYADLIDGKKVFRDFPNYVSEYFNSKKEAEKSLQERLSEEKQRLSKEKQYATGGGVDNKWKYLFFVQGSYGQGFEDLTAHENREDAKAEMRVYDENENYPHRVILRKVLTSDYEKGKYKRGGGVSGKDNRAKKVVRNVNGFRKEFPIGDAWRKEHNEYNESQKHEIRYAKKKNPSRTGYKGKTNYARGGFVSKAELVWRKLSSSDRMNFLIENFTPEITPRSQEILVGKSYNFLPKKVKIVLASKYANVEEYAGGGQVMEIQKIKNRLISKAKSKGIYENFGQNEVRMLIDKYGNTNEVREFDNWAMNFDMSDLKQYAMGGGIEDSPRIYVADLEAYNDGRLNGEWLKLTDYNNADELMEAIQELLDKWGVEEYAIHDTEYIPSNLSSEYMGQKDFEQLYEMIDLANEYNLPLEVVQDVVSQFDASAVEEYQGKYDSAIDFAEQQVDEVGLKNFSSPEYYVYITDTDRRLLAGDMSDSYVEDIKNEDGGNRVIKEAGLDVSEYEEADSNRQDEMLDEAVEIVREEYYNTWYDGLDDPYYFLVEEQGLYSADDFANSNFVQIDYEKIASALEDDYTFIYDSNSDLYVFNIR